jgi:hypothetical protein
MEQRGDAEPIAHLIPRRAIETWILCLAGEEVDEETDYRHHSKVDDNLKQAAKRLREITRPKAFPSGGIVTSLVEAIPEVRRLDRSISA